MKPENRSIIDYIGLIVKGILMGTANKVPGISGGIIAFVGGFYEEFIFSLNQLNLTAFKLFIRLKWKRLYSYVNGNF